MLKEYFDLSYSERNDLFTINTPSTCFYYVRFVNRPTVRVSVMSKYRFGSFDFEIPGSIHVRGKFRDLIIKIQ